MCVQVKRNMAKATMAHVLGGSVADMTKAALVAVTAALANADADASFSAVQLASHVAIVHGRTIVARVQQQKVRAVAEAVRLVTAALPVGGQRLAVPLSVRLSEGCTMHPTHQRAVF